MSVATNTGTEAPTGGNHDDVIDSQPRLPLDSSLYSLDEEDITFLKSQTGITDGEELKNHVIKVQTEAYAIHPYPCIRRFVFASTKISRHPAYQTVLKLGKERPGALFLDIGCCFGTDIRKAVADGYPVDQVIGSDLRPEYWDLSHKLFRTTQETSPGTFIPGDALSEDFLKWEPLRDTPPSTPVDLRSLQTLTPLNGRLSVIHASAFFHLFPEETQFRLAQLMSSLLSPEPGSIIFGGHVGAETKGNVDENDPDASLGKKPMFCHSAESWIEMWENEVFKEKKVKVSAELHEIAREGDHKIVFLIWSVTRL